MHTIRRTAGGSVAVVGMAAAVALFAPPAYGAAPYTANASISVSNTNPAEGGTLTIFGLNFGSNEVVANDLLSKLQRLGTVTTDAAGSFTASVTLPMGFTCAHTIRSTGQTSDRSATAKITIGSCDGSGDGGGSNLPRTGAVALAGLGILGLGLLGGGMVLVAKRRKVDA